MLYLIASKVHVQHSQWILNALSLISRPSRSFRLRWANTECVMEQTCVQLSDFSLRTAPCIPQCLHVIKQCRTLVFYVLEHQYQSYIWLGVAMLYLFVPFCFSPFPSSSLCSWLKRFAGLKSRVFFTWSHICFKVQPRDLFVVFFFLLFIIIIILPNKLVNMLFVLCVTPVVSLQMQLCSSSFNGETNGNSSEFTWTAAKLVLAVTNFNPESNIFVPMYC